MSEGQCFQSNPIYEMTGRSTVSIERLAGDIQLKIEIEKNRKTIQSKVIIISEVQ